ncbi:hypothetical protein HXX76_002105 [Chlamydomonas incerta]|uniref:Uncharacterized protein n=1 Tax=Chlamydomonas incerta TaxID=51695 RepID=A0A835WAF7_CHLIN|nr:hypothetical protein HXX76_002105 [Chlamydomonas incerta]|eukprot:KAG2443759.1 hypothetical protein HXX76_002105 [Chlamydomonas incerta]
MPPGSCRRGGRGPWRRSGAWLAPALSAAGAHSEVSSWGCRGWRPGRRASMAAAAAGCQRRAGRRSRGPASRRPAAAAAARAARGVRRSPAVA